MNALLNKFPTKIRIDDTDYEINTDYRNCLKIILAFEDDELTIEEQYFIMLNLLYKEMPENIELAIEKAILFLNCGKGYEVSDSKRTYSFNKDSKYIYSAMNQTHNIDLESIEYLHWWKFVFLFMDVDKDCTFSYITSLRYKKNNGKLDNYDKKIWVEMREIVDLDYSCEDEEESEFMKLLNGGDADAQVMEH
jgi:hypothetical protein